MAGRTRSTRAARRRQWYEALTVEATDSATRLTVAYDYLRAVLGRIPEAERAERVRVEAAAQLMRTAVEVDRETDRRRKAARAARRGGDGS